MRSQHSVYEMDGDTLSRPASSFSISSPKSNYSEILDSVDDYIGAVPDEMLEGYELDDTPLRLGNRSDELQTLGKRKELASSDDELIYSSRPTKVPRIDLCPETDSPIAATDSVTNGSPSASSSSSDTLVDDGVIDVRPVIIAYSQPLRGYVDRLPYGAQWEIARFVSAGLPYERFTISMLADIAKYRTNAKSAPEVNRIVAEEIANRPLNFKDLRDDVFAHAFAKEKSLKLPWEELDKEEAVLNKCEAGGLGCNEDAAYLEGSSWYGGRVNFTAKVSLAQAQDTKDESSIFQLRLDKPTLGLSNKFARRFGSRKFIRVRIAKEVYLRSDKKARETDLLDYFRRPFVILGRVFRAFYAKEQNVFLFQTNEIWDGSEISNTKPRSCGGSQRQDLSFLGFINFHNDLTYNTAQTMAKWAARFALGLSNSVPGFRLRPSEIAFEDDIVCDAWNGVGKVPNEQIMTDGCGLIRLDTLQEIAGRLGLQTVPIAIQVRVCDSKGMLLSHPNSHRISEAMPRIWLRPSQIKIKHSSMPGVPDDIDPAMLTIDVLRPSRMSTPARLSTETIINFAENGVPTDIFVKMMQDSVRKKVEGLTTWDGELGFYRLWTNVAHAGGVFSARLAREAAGAARAKGLIFEDFTDEDGDEDGFALLDKAMEDRSTAWWDDPISGCPSSLEETVMTLLDSGFHPDTCPVLAAKLHEVVKRAVNSYVKRYHIDIPQSCRAFVVPDPLGVLEPGEVHIKSSSHNLVDQDGQRTDTILGDVLVTRHPCKVPTDAQKVKAVFREQLRGYVDVIVVSTKNHTFGDKFLNRHLASCTGGGDYDGDTMEAFWQPEMVSSFRNADPKFLKEPESVQRSLSKNTEMVPEFLSRNPPSTSKEALIYELQKYLLGALKDSSMVGMYSTWWENAIYKYGYHHETTIFLAYMFCAILDGSKTGVTVSKDVFDAHRKAYAHRAPAWKETDEECQRHARWPGFNEPNLPRGKGLGVFIMDEIHKEVHKEAGKQLKHVDRIFSKKITCIDEQMAQPWEDVMRRARRLQDRGNGEMMDEIELIKGHVQRLYEKWQKRIPENARSGGKGNKFGFTALPIEKRQDLLRELSREFHSGPVLKGTKRGDDELLYIDRHELRRACASYAYVYDYEKSSRHWSRFPWDVSMRVLCEIKAGANGLSKTMKQDFYTKMKIHGAYLDKP